MEFMEASKRIVPGRSWPAAFSALLLALVWALAACQVPRESALPSGTGILSLSIRAPSARTLVPALDMTIASYTISGSGPKGKTFNIVTTNSNVSVSGIATGAWSVGVNATNSTGALIAQGSGSVTVQGQASLVVQVNPLAGSGSLHLAVKWVAANVGDPSIQAQLLPVSGAPIPLSFALDSGSAVADASGLPAGYYTLGIQLLDGEIVVMGAVEVARILTGQTTTGTYDFTRINQAHQGTAPPGMVEISIVPEMGDPLTVSMSGQLATLDAGTTVTITASVSNYAQNVTYVWYLNGQILASGSTASPSVTCGSGLEAGIYRLDVAAFSADGSRAGDCSTTFTVQ